MTDEEVLTWLVHYCEDHVGAAQGWQNTYGYTCDELGCAICNADSAVSAAKGWFDAWLEGYASLPFDL